MRRRHRTPPRSPLTRRAVVAFLDTAALGEVEAFRRAHDPLAGVVRAHVTLVFPFASALSALQVATHVRRVASRWPVLPVRLEGVDAYVGEWVHLRVTQGTEAVVELHDRLYRGVLAPFLRSEFDYLPHVTLARAADAAECDALVREARHAFAQPVDTVVRTLSTIVLSREGRVDIEADIGLGA
jgi:2'-5' RNA ligase